ncbi:hypothetical protein ABB37_00087 [Leptomonas pyrrhocoris]|uniref:Arrestin-like N-terminal domain-containing protein n=1 Tax=Leptomonas pyrrhocoris TaxID=157538 RepID=A0A0N1J5E7_LEPPY|nr:hypothetical protein ABB37_00087 [Leptomonas pyrrhocoris]XP_015664157.1 hypothetical protein ABB37_00087 [Leptomonas pyrrhocoris]KPA85717.1 hypothetical protein ABB37_00087 [Leptomonas pyrrhocoris]KPA85718.1 hypothetical protein ABB37_00087 [Leptomonas pyrrhocoris]|eukprot:XP_015664156.1 hypothetical protein ABB37_00087 [Leptomonas pyrrhocoris]
MFFDRDKVKLQIDTDGKTAFQPGQAVTGCLRVEVVKDVDVTAIRLFARGKETTSFTVKKSGSGRQTSEESYVHYEHLITFFGFSKESGRTGGASLQAGNYEYPFQFVLPVTAPPSYRCRMSAGTAELTYILRAVVDIPRGFDGKEEVSFVVLPTIAQQQYDQLRGASKEATNPNLALSIDPGCCGMNKDPGAALQLTAVVPMIAFIPPPVYSYNTTNENYALGSLTTAASGDAKVMVRLTLQNLCRKAHIHCVHVVLQQHQRLMAQGNVADALQTIATTEVSPPSGKLIPRTTATFDVPLRLPDAVRYASKMSKSAPLPTMETPCLQVSNVLTISFPGLGAEAVVTISDVFPVVAAIDSTNSVPMIPCSYRENTIYPEEKLGAE